MPNPRSTNVGGLVMTAECRPDPVARGTNSDYEVSLENQGYDRYVVTHLEVTVDDYTVGRSGLLLQRNGTAKPADSTGSLGTYARFAYGSWTWAAVNQHTQARAENLTATAVFQRQAARSPLVPPALVSSLRCSCTVNVLVQ